MKLTELDPRWWALHSVATGSDTIKLGLTFECPCGCKGTERETRLGVPIDPPIDPQRLLQNTTWIGYPTMWKRGGESFDALTLTPSIDASQHGHWHGHITNGEIR